MQLKNNKMIARTSVLIAVVALTGAIGVVLSAQMGPRRSMGQGQGPGMMGGPGMMDGQGQRGRGMGDPGMMGGPGRGRRGMGGPGMMGGPGGGPFGMLGFALRELNLTEDQHQQIRKILEARKDELKAAGGGMMEARKALHDAITSETSDEALIREKAKAVGDIEADVAVLRAQIHKEAFKVLTTEQQQKARELRTQMEERMKNGRGRMRQQVDERPDQKRGGSQAV